MARVCSPTFSVQNGVKHVGDVSLVKSSVFPDGISRSGSCFIGDMCVVILAYADDLVILSLAPSATRLE